MSAEEILMEVKSILETISYVKKVYIGIRKEGVKALTPCIILEPVDNPTEERKDLRKNTFTLLISGFIYVMYVDKSIIGDAIHPGCMDIERDIKEKLYATFPTLNGKCERFVLSTVDYPGDFPVRGVNIEAKFFYTEE